ALQNLLCSSSPLPSPTLSSLSTAVSQTSCVGSLRSFATSTRHQLKNKVPEHQKLFQADNDLPVHLKGGMVDGLLYRLTMTIAVFGSCYSVFSLVRAAFPQKNK
uniref:Cytochrome c oxidase subunit 7A1, mitochondrial n=1 Tax=Chelonoidis abingdonii TaxID=106734 RepID=A0A8C0GK52_CHEAB